MKIAILETGVPPENLEERFGRYTDMLIGLIGEGDYQYQVFDAQSCEFPHDPAAWDAIAVMGSPAGVYDPLPWIEPLQAFLRAAKGKTRLIGICFGHQVMAAAFGGKVEKSGKGWGIGLHTFEVVNRQPWMAEAPEAISIPVSHQDQVVEQPPNSQVIAASRFTPFAALAYTDQPAISFQFHPEFETEYAARLIERRIQRHDVSEEHADLALASLKQPDDRPLVARWVRDFLAS